MGSLRVGRLWSKIRRVYGHLHQGIMEEFARPKYGWFGDYERWEDVVSISSGYDADGILQRVAAATRQVVSGEAVYERDSVPFKKAHWNWPLLASLCRIAAARGGSVNVLDFGGSLGSVYFQNRSLLGSMLSAWHVVEQPHFVSCGKGEFEDGSLQFWGTVDECLEQNTVDVLLLSSVLPYIEQPHELLDDLLAKRFPFVLIDRTGIVDRGKDRLTLQRVDPAIYSASYPCWFFDQSRLCSHFEAAYEEVFSFDSFDRVNIRAKTRGFLYRLAEDGGC